MGSVLLAHVKDWLMVDGVMLLVESGSVLMNVNVSVERSD